MEVASVQGLVWEAVLVEDSAVDMEVASAALRLVFVEAAVDSEKAGVYEGLFLYTCCYVSHDM